MLFYSYWHCKIGLVQWSNSEICGYKRLVFYHNKTPQSAICVDISWDVLYFNINIVRICRWVGFNSGRSSKGTMFTIVSSMKHVVHCHELLSLKCIVLLVLIVCNEWQHNMRSVVPEAGMKDRDKYSISQEICTRSCCALLCCGYAIVHNEFTWSIYPYSSGLLCWHWGNR